MKGNSIMMRNETDTYPLPMSLSADLIPDDAFGLTIGTSNYTIVRTFELHFTPPTLFLFFVLGVFILTAMLHGRKCLQVMHGTLNYFSWLNQ